MNTFLLIDGNGLVHRAFHALPDFTTKDGLHTNAVFGFATSLHKTIIDFNPTHIVVCFDTKAPTFRDKLFEEYRIQRPEIKDELKNQFPLIKEFLVASGIYQIEKDGLEADDLLGIIATEIKKTADKVIILSADKDLMQLVSQNVFILTPQLGFGKSKLYTPEEVKKTFGIDPDQIPDYKALAGDQSDNYKGVTGIGPKTAVTLLTRFKTLEQVYRHLEDIESERVKAALIEHKKNALLSKKLATILTHDHIKFPVDQTHFTNYNEALRAFFTRLEFRSLENRFFPKTVQKIEKKISVEKNPDQQSLF